jgi:hypothetical protein
LFHVIHRIKRRNRCVGADGILYLDHFLKSKKGDIGGNE